MAKEGTPSLPVDELAVGNALPEAQPGSSGAGGLSSKRRLARASRFSVIAMMWVAACLVAQAEQSVSLAWDPSPDTNVMGYAVFYGNVSGTYGSRLDAGANMTAAIPGLVEG